MLKKLNKLSGLTIAFLLVFNLMAAYAFAQDESAETPQSTSFKGICQQIEEGTGAYAGFPSCANTPADCGSDNNHKYPVNCLFLEEPIGGEPGYDLYKVTCYENPEVSGQQVCDYALWHGEAIPASSSEAGIHIRGPVQALLTYKSGEESQGGLGLFYSYLGIIYKFMSGIIVGFVVLVSIIGGITMTTSAGNQEQFDKGKSMIIKSLIGMVLWFLASVILYTINPTFFTF